MVLKRPRELSVHPFLSHNIPLLRVRSDGLSLMNLKTQVWW